VKERISPTHPSQHRRLRTPCGAAVLLIALAVMLSGFLMISVANDSSAYASSDSQIEGSLGPFTDLGSGGYASSNHQLVVGLTEESDVTSPIRRVFAVRIPEAWEVTSVRFNVGPSADQWATTRSTTMEDVYEDEWESATGPGYNGHKDGYKWWVIYTAAKTWAEGQGEKVCIYIDTHGRGGTYLIDFVMGLAAATNPEDTANHTDWYIGSAGASPRGVLLDQAVTLYSFTDVVPGVEYFDAIQGMAALGLIAGYPASSGYYEFRPTNPVLRAQFAKMIDGALGLVVDEAMVAPVNFTDLGSDKPADLYPHEYVWVAYNSAIIKGYSDGTFRPYTAISRGHVITMTVRALLNLHPEALEPVPDDFVQTWGNDLPPEHRANARVAEYNSLLADLPLSTTAANGNASMPRGEVAQVLWNMINLLAGP
jgi:hypothetical protein